MKDAAAREQQGTETGAFGHGLRVPFSGGGAAGAPAADVAPAEDVSRRPATRRRLARLVAAKLALDLLFVGAFALYTHAVTYRPGFEGGLEYADGVGARGWVVDLERPGEPVEVQLFDNGRFLASVVADEVRSDTDAAAAGGGRRGFTLTFARDLYGEHEIRAYAVRESRGGSRRTLYQVGGPVGFAWK